MNLRKAVRVACVLLALIFTTSAFADEPKPIEKAFNRAKPHLKVVSGSVKDGPDEGMDVFLKGSEIVCLDYFGGTTNTQIRQKFFFEKAVPVLAVETVSDLRDQKGDLRQDPLVKSVQRYDLTSAAPDAKGRELHDHCEKLIKYYHAHRKDFEENAED